jgi:TolA-binding protein
MTRLASSIASVALALAASGGCKSEKDHEDTSKVIEEVRDDVASARMDVEQKRKELQGASGPDVTAERQAFIDDMEKELAELDRDIGELRAELERRSAGMTGEARREIPQRLADLNDVRAQARSALDRFKQATATAGVSREETSAAIERTRSAYQAARDRHAGGGAAPDTTRGPDQATVDRKLDRKVDRADKDQDGTPDQVEIK